MLLLLQATTTAESIWIPAISGLVGVLIGGVIGIIGSVLNDRWATHRQKDQLQHDAEQRDRERKMALRINVFLQTAEAVVRSTNRMSRLGNLEIADSDVMDGYERDLAEIGKIQVVGNQETVHAISQFMNAYAATVLELVLKRIALQILDVKVEQRRRSVEGALNNRNDFYEKWKDALEKKDTFLPPGYFKENYKNWSENYQQWSEELSALEKRVIPERLELVELAITLSMRVSGFLNPAIVAVRKELEIPMDVDAFMKLASEATITQQTMMSEFLKRARELLAEGQQP